LVSGSGNEEINSLQREFTITGLSEGHVYRLKYRVLNHLGWSEFSPFSSLLAAGVPAKPSKPSMVSVSASELALSFLEVLENGGSPIVRYVLYVRAESSASRTEVTTYAGVSMAHTLTVSTDTALVVGETHYF
jgi:hypothetical protein